MENILTPSIIFSQRAFSYFPKFLRWVLPTYFGIIHHASNLLCRRESKNLEMVQFVAEYVSSD